MPPEFSRLHIPSSGAIPIIPAKHLKAVKQITASASPPDPRLRALGMKEVVVSGAAPGVSL
ncbi:hypothetical protein EYF80_059713 [Liparis tanakae]|uniref:Uncharacterized protein n=1 Tax=Liparis tanakae TaxID=230148 RepID=A0A4Z2ENV0_9TELE|nr:hypothetical protein EYF80_059713 [Liparis tanakae]